MKRNSQAIIVSDDVLRTWAVAFFGIDDREQSNEMAQLAIRQLWRMNMVTEKEIAYMRMKFPHLVNW